MDPNNSGVPTGTSPMNPAVGANPVGGTAGAAAPIVNTNPENPATAVANAAMAGATPNVVTTDLNAADVAPASTIVGAGGAVGTEPTAAAGVGAVPAAGAIAGTAPAAGATAGTTPAASGAGILDMNALNAVDPAAVQEAAPNLAAPANDSDAATKVANDLASSVEPAGTSGPITIAPSADFQMTQTATVSADPNAQAAAAQDPGLVGSQATTNSDPATAGLDAMSGNASTGETIESSDTAPGPEDFTNVKADDNTDQQVDYKDNPVVPAAPVPGSIGSAKSYADIQKEEVARAAKLAAQAKKKKLTKKQIMIGAIAGIVLVGGIVTAVVMVSANNANKTKPATTSNNNDGNNNEPVVSILTCRRNLGAEEFAPYGAVSGTQVNTFKFADDALDGLETDLNYTFTDANLAEMRRVEWLNKYGISEEGVTSSENGSTASENNGGETAEPATNTAENSGDKVSGKKTVAEMLKRKVTLKDMVLTDHAEVDSEDIEDWLKSDGYSDEMYGAKKPAEQTGQAETPDTNGDEPESGVEEDDSEDSDDSEGEIERNLSYYQGLQNGIGYSCSVSEQ